MSHVSCYNEFDGGCLMIDVTISLMEDVSCLLLQLVRYIEDVS